MEDRKLVIFFLFFLLIYPLNTFAYKPETTHKGLTGEIIRFYEHFYPSAFTGDEKFTIEKGAVDEDAGTRARNHFYDPVYNKAIIPTALTSKDWSQDTLAQAGIAYKATLGNVVHAYFSSDSDYSWDRAVYEYVHGDKKRGLEGLGHILHLIEDATVPDHTRDDPHPDFFWNDILGQESPYENFTDRFNAGNMKISENLIREEKKPVLLGSLNEYFNELANYSNNNFFSKDTVFDKKYSNPIIKYEKSEKLSDSLVHTFGYNNLGSKLVEIKRERNKSTGIVELSYIYDDRDHPVIVDNWNLLSREAVQNGAGVIKLFFDAVEEEKKTLALEKKNKSWIARQMEQMAGAFFAVGDSMEATSLPEELPVVSGNLEAKPPSESTVLEEVTGEINNKPKLKEETDNRTIQIENEPNLEVQPPSSAGNVITPIVVENSTGVPVDNVPMPKFNFGPNGISPGFGGDGGASSLANSNQQTTNNNSIIETPVATTTSETATSTLAICEDAFANNNGGSLPCTYPPLKPAVTSPADFSAPFATTTITFSGTSTPAFVISNDLTSATTSTDSSGNWSIIFTNLAQGTTTLHFIATDTSGATSSPREIIFGIVIPPSPPNLGSKQIGYYCSPYTQSFIEGGYYTSTGNQCYYIATSFSNLRYGDVYKGTIGSSTIVNGHSLNSWATSTPQSNDLPAVRAQGDSFFTVIYEVHNGDAVYINSFRNYFQTGGTVPYQEYGVINWKYGTAP